MSRPRLLTVDMDGDRGLHLHLMRLMRSLLRLSRSWTLLLLLYIVVDFTDPSVPGVFFFDSGLLFIDSAIQLKSNAMPQLAAPELTPLGRRSDDEKSAASKVRAPTRPHVPRLRQWRTPIRGDSASFASSSSLPDTPPSLPLS